MADDFESPVWVDGRRVAAGTPVVRADDPGFAQGLAVFETLLAEDGHVYFLEDHLARLEEGARAVGIAWPPGVDPGEGVQALARERPRAALRVTLTPGARGAGPSVLVTLRALEEPPSGGVRVRLTPVASPCGDRRGDGPGFAPTAVKSNSRLLYHSAREQARADGAWEALLVDGEGHLLEGSVTNVFVAREGTLATPPVGVQALPGITRARVLAGLAGCPRPVEVRPVTLTELEDATELFLTSSTLRVLAVREVVGDLRAPRLAGAEGPWARRAAEALVREEELDRLRGRNPALGPR